MLCIFDHGAIALKCEVLLANLFASLKISTLVGIFFKPPENGLRHFQ